MLLTVQRYSFPLNPPNFWGIIRLSQYVKERLFYLLPSPFGEGLGVRPYSLLIVTVTTGLTLAVAPKSAALSPDVL